MKLTEAQKEAKLAKLARLNNEKNQPDGCQRYDEKGRAICPQCDTAVELGNVGILILSLRHLDSDTCLDAQRRKGKDDGLKQSFLGKFFRPKKKSERVPTQAAAPLVIPTQSVSQGDVDTSIDTHQFGATADHSVVPVTVDTHETANDSEKRPTVWRDLVGITKHLTEPSPDSQNTFLSEFDQIPAMYDLAGVSNDELFEEELNPLLHRVFGYGGSIGGTRCKGVTRERVRGVVRFVEYFVWGTRRMDWGLFEPRIERLVDEIRHTGRVRTDVPELENDSTVRNADEEARNNGPESIELVSHDEDDTARLTTPIRLPNDSSTAATRCSGYALECPNGISPHAAYPFALHDRMSLPWDYTVRNGRMTLYSRSCEGEAQPKGRACRYCVALGRNNVLLGVLDRMRNGVKQGSGWAYHGIGSLHELLRFHKKQAESHRLRNLNHTRKLARKAAELSQHKRFLLAIASKKVERVDRIIRLGLRNGRGIRGLLEQLMRAAKGSYKPKDYQEEDYMRGLLLWKLGGNRIASIAHRSLGLPSITTLKNQARMPPIRLSSGKPTVEDVSTNVEASFEGIEETMKLRGGARNHHAVFMVDELATEGRLRWDPKTTGVLVKTTYIDALSCGVVPSLFMV